MQAIGVRVNTALTTATAEAVKARLCLVRAAGQRHRIQDGAASLHTLPTLLGLSS
jgi:hypothetical protein